MLFVLQFRRLIEHRRNKIDASHVLSLGRQSAADDARSASDVKSPVGGVHRNCFSEDSKRFLSRMSRSGRKRLCLFRELIENAFVMFFFTAVHLLSMTCGKIALPQCPGAG